jgi:hypothetical protein
VRLAIHGSEVPAAHWSAVPCLNQAETRGFSATPLMLEAPHLMPARGAAVPGRRRGELGNR